MIFLTWFILTHGFVSWLLVDKMHLVDFLMDCSDLASKKEHKRFSHLLSELSKCRHCMEFWMSVIMTGFVFGYIEIFVGSSDWLHLLKIPIFSTGALILLSKRA
jgi:hypothetical protein